MGGTVRPPALQPPAPARSFRRPHGSPPTSHGTASLRPCRAARRNDVSIAGTPHWLLRPALWPRRQRPTAFWQPRAMASGGRFSAFSSWSDGALWVEWRRESVRTLASLVRASASDCPITGLWQRASAAACSASPIPWARPGRAACVPSPVASGASHGAWCMAAMPWQQSRCVGRRPSQCQRGWCAPVGRPSR